MPYSEQTASQLRDKPTPTPSIDSLISRLSAEEHSKVIEQKKQDLGSFAYFRLPKRFMPYQDDPDSIDYRFQNESFRRKEAL